MKITLGQKIRYYRKEAGLTQTQLAELAKCSQPTIFSAENDINVKVSTLQDIGKALGRTLVMDLVE